MESVPKDVLLLIIRRLSEDDVRSVALTCKHFKGVIRSDDTLRRMVLYRNFDLDDEIRPIVLVELLPDDLTALSLAIVSSEEFRGINKAHYFRVHSLWIAVFIGTAAYLMQEPNRARHAWTVVQLFQITEDWDPGQIIWNCEVICKIKGLFSLSNFACKCCWDQCECRNLDLNFRKLIVFLHRFQFVEFFVCSISASYGTAARRGTEHIFQPRNFC
jgi:hypothetical protein